KSIFGSSSNSSAGAVRRLGPIVNPGRRIPIRGTSTGSVRTVTPKKLISTVECPIQANVTCASLHFEGLGLAEAGEIGRQPSIAHSRQRWVIQRRAPKRVGVEFCIYRYIRPASASPPAHITEMITRRIRQNKQNAPNNRVFILSVLLILSKVRRL